jgi:YcxB-like protein
MRGEGGRVASRREGSGARGRGSGVWAVNYKFSVRYDEQNYLAANRLHFWSNLRSLKSLRTVAWLFGLYFVLGLVMSILDEVKIDGWAILRLTIISLTASAAVLLFCYAFCYLNLARQTRKLLTQQKFMQEDLQYDASDALLSVTSVLSNTKLPYDMAHKWAENSRVFLIYLSDQSFLYVPKEQMHADAIDMIRKNLVAANISGKTL